MFTIRGKNILIVDDVSDITFTIKSILEYNGFKVDSFTDPISTLDHYQINFYDLEPSQNYPPVDNNAVG